MLWGFSTWGLIGGGNRVACDNVPIRIPEWGWQYMIGWLNDINRLVSKDKREPRVIPAENTHTLTLALHYNVSAQAAYLLQFFFVFLKTSMLETFLSFSYSINCLFSLNCWNQLSNRYKSFVAGRRKHNSGCWGCIWLHHFSTCACRRTALSALKMSPAVMTAQL